MNIINLKNTKTMENKEKQSELLEITNDFFKKVNSCFGDNTPGNVVIS